MGLNIQEVANGASVKPGLPKGLGEPSEAAAALNVEKISEEEQNQSKVQLATRLGIPVTELNQII